MSSINPSSQSPAIDRVIHDVSIASPLLYDEAHSIFPIESVCGLVEITMHLDATKLRKDIERMAPVKGMITRRYLVPLPNSRTKRLSIEQEWLSPRSFIVGLPADNSWSPQNIAVALRQIQLDLRPPTHVHGLYVMGIGYFQTIPVDSPSEAMYRIRAWTGSDRLFCFTTAFRQAFDLWGSLPPGWCADLRGYVDGHSEVLAE